MGRPNEHREKLTCYVKPKTKRAIAKSIVKGDKEKNTAGKVVDEAMKAMRRISEIKK